jgi:UDP-glucose 4-epimerase
MLQVLKGKDHVIHLAAVTSNVEFIKDPRECYDANVNGCLSVLDASVKNGCRTVVYASSAAVYLDAFSEEATIDVNRQSNHYAKSKIMNEMNAHSYADIFGVRTIGLRYFNVYGDGENEKGDYASIVSIFLRARKHHEPLVVYGDGRQARDLINVRDAARMTLELLERGSERVYNVGTGIARAYLEIAEKIAKHAVQFVPNPLKSYQYYTRADTSRLRATVGEYRFIELERGMREMKM